MMRPSFNVTTKDVENEIQAVKAIRSSGEHPNLVQILRYGPLEDSSYYFVDMELCDLSLSTYICGERPSQIAAPVDNTPPSFRLRSFVENDCSLSLKAQNVCTIMSHIANGLEFLHRHAYVHRDLKPENGTAYKDIFLNDNNVVLEQMSPVENR